MMETGLLVLGLRSIDTSRQYCYTYSFERGWPLILYVYPS